uniref:Apoptotic chromatin condensation inducer in the nucleus n=1 Tax=Rhipicephalus zambeziensis TaxID=60191 RepID=A0A224YCE2_9ACAR
MPVSVVSSGSLTNTHKQNEEAQAVSTVPSSLCAGFTVTQQQQQQHQQHQDASSLGSCDSTTESCNTLQHPTALSIKECPVICPDANSAKSWSAKGQRYDGSVLAPDSTIVEFGALHHYSSPNTANLMGPVQPNSTMGIQDTEEMPAIIPCSNTHKSGAICQFSRPHENDGIPSKPMQGDQQMQTTQGGRAAQKEIKDNTSVSGEIMDSNDAMKSRSPVRCACDDFNPAERKLENKDNFDNSRVSPVCSEEANFAITGEPFATTAEMKEDVKNATAEHKQSVMTAHEVSSELENNDKIEITNRTCTISPSEILLQKHENVDETKNEAMAANTQMIILLSNRANATSDELLVDENDSFQREKCSSHNNQNKQEVGGNLHLRGTSSKHPPSTKPVIINAHVVHEASATSQDFSQECTNISIPEHSEELGTDARHEQESVKEFESLKFGGLQQAGTEEPSNSKLDVTGSTNISVKARYATDEGAETICVPHSSTLKNENASEHSNLSSVVPEDGTRSQGAETTLTSANMEGNDDSNAFYSPSETCFTGPYATPEPSNMEPTPTAFEHKEKYANRTNSEFAHSPTGLSRSTAQVEYSIATHAALHISGTERTVNLAHMDISDSDQAVEKHTPRIPESDFSTDEHLGRSEEIVNSSSNFAVNDELVLGFTAENRQHCAPIPAENIPKDLEIQGKEHILSPSNCATGNDNSAIYDSKGTKEDSIQMDATTCTEQHGADLTGADGVDTDVAATGSMEFRSCSKSHAGTAASNSCGADSFGNAASPTRKVERQCSVSCNNSESQPHEACDPLQQNCGKSDASAGLQHQTREAGRYVLGRVDSSNSSGDTSCSESEEQEMARLRGRGVRKQVPARATKESSEASSDGEGSEAGNRRLRNGRRATPEEPQAMRRSSRNRKAAAEESPKEDSDAATEPESTPGSPQLEEGQVLSPVNEEEEQKPEGKEASEGSSSSSSSESSDTSDGEEEPVGRRGLKGVLASPPGRRQAPSEGPRSPPNSEPAQEEDVKSQEEPAETKTVEPDQHPPQEERPSKESVPEDVEMKDDEESQPASGASPPKFKTRRLSIAALKKDSEDKEERPQRKRKWGPMNVVLGPSMGISTAALKDLIPDIQEPLSKPKELEEEHVTASVGESPVTEQEEASDEPPVKLQAVDDEPTSEEMPPCNDNTEKDQEKGEDGEPSHGEKSSRGDRIDKASRDEKPNDDRLPRSERFSRDEKEKPLSRDEKTSKTEKPPREVSRDDKPGRHDANTKETKGARERASPITAPSAERKALHVISDRAPLSKRPAAGKDEAEQRKLASPPRNPKSRILFVRNLVRPFTLNQLKQLLQEFGDTIDSEFWIDKIKSKCFVTYVSEEDAVKAREALHNLRWPLCNPKILHVDFSSPEEMERQKEPPTPPPPRPVAAATERTLPAFQRTVEVDTRMPIGREVLRDPREVLRDPREPREIKDPREPKDPREARGTVSGPPARPDRNLMVERQAVNRRPALPVREWDRDKLRQETPPPPPAERAPAQSRNRATSPPDKRERRDKKVAKRKSEEDTPAKLLDDLFRKTKASPCIYWLPLTEEQIARKEEERKQRRQERERRRQQQQLQEEEERRKRALARDMAAKTKQESKRSGSHSPVRRR